MNYTFDKMLDMPFSDAITRVIEALNAKGFGVLSTIDVQKAMKERINEHIRPYTILGACSPRHAFRALSLENKIGSMMPCNVVVQEQANGQVEISAVDPVASMNAINNPHLREVATEVRGLLQTIINEL